MMATCGPGDEVLIPAPYWVSYPEMCRLAGADPVVLPTAASEGFLLTPEKLEAALTPKSRLLILCSPSNPSGAVYPREHLAKLAEVCAKHPRLLVLSDEIYEHITYETEHASIASFLGMRERTLVVNGFSKAFAMTGWRLGYLAAPAHFAKAAASIQSQTTSGPSSISQEAGLAALKVLGPRGGEPVRAMVEAFRRRRDLVCARIRETRREIVLNDPTGAFYVFPDVSGLVGDGCEAEGFGPVPDADALCRYLLEKAQVALVPGSAFGAPECVRISYAAADDVLNEALDRIAEALSPDVYKVERE